MQGLRKLFSSFSAGPGPAPASSSAAPDASADAAANADFAPTQPGLPMEAEAPPSLPALRPAARPATRALRTTTRPSTSVAVSVTPAEPVLPTPATPTDRVVLTQTERVRLRIMQAQIRLASIALYEGPVDGMLTLETATALRYFQTLKGLRESGQPTAATLRALGIPADK